MYIWGVADLVSESDFDFLDGIWGMEFRYRRVRRFISKEYRILLETCDIRNIYCLSSTCCSFVFSLLDGSLRN